MLNLPVQCTTVTTFSKILAMILFITLPFVGFLLGMQYQARISPSFPHNAPDAVISPKNSPDDGVACTMDAKICPDGTAVGHIPPDCNFEPCPLSVSPAITRPSVRFEGCLEDMQICPDGSTVVRIPPACQFAPCPESSDEAVQ